MVIDSLDQLRDAGAGLRDWVPAQLPSNVHFILSTIPGVEYRIELQLKVCKFMVGEGDSCNDITNMYQ